MSLQGTWLATSLGDFEANMDSIETSIVIATGIDQGMR